MADETNGQGGKPWRFATLWIRFNEWLRRPPSSAEWIAAAALLLGLTLLASAIVVLCARLAYREVVATPWDWVPEVFAWVGGLGMIAAGWVAAPTLRRYVASWSGVLLLAGLVLVVCGSWMAPLVLEAAGNADVLTLAGVLAIVSGAWGWFAMSRRSVPDAPIPSAPAAPVNRGGGFRAPRGPGRSLYIALVVGLFGEWCVARGLYMAYSGLLLGERFTTPELRPALWGVLLILSASLWAHATVVRAVRQAAPRGDPTTNPHEARRAVRASRKLAGLARTGLAAFFCNTIIIFCVCLVASVWEGGLKATATDLFGTGADATASSLSSKAVATVLGLSFFLGLFGVLYTVVDKMRQLRQGAPIPEDPQQKPPAGQATGDPAGQPAAPAASAPTTGAKPTPLRVPSDPASEELFDYFEFWSGLLSKTGITLLLTLLVFFVYWNGATDLSALASGQAPAADEPATATRVAKAYAWLPVVAVVLGLTSRGVEDLIIALTQRFQAGVTGFLKGPPDATGSAQ